MSSYRIADEVIDPTTASGQASLALAHGTQARPLCLCMPAGAEMYIAKAGTRYIIKRMPGTGPKHSVDCMSYEPPGELSGLGQVLGSAISEDIGEGTVTLKLGFSLAKTPGKAPPTPSASESSTASTSGTKLSLRGMFDYLWDQAGLTRWVPGMAGKRNWHVVRNRLLEAATNKTTKGLNLPTVLFVPEVFSVDRKDEIARRRTAALKPAAAPEKGPRKLMIVLAEVKEFAPSRFGQKVIVKHLPDLHFSIQDDMHKQLNKRFSKELAAWDMVPDSHLLMLATFGLNPAGYAALEEATLVLTSSNWIPFANAYEKQLLDALTQEGRAFIKGLAYNLPSTKPLAATVLTDTANATAMYVVPPDASEEYLAELQGLVDESELQAWEWRAGDDSMPALPQKGRRSD